MPEQKIVPAFCNPVELLPGDRGGVFVYVVGKFYLSLQLDMAVLAVINPDSVLFPEIYSCHFLIISAVPIVIKIQAADHINPILGMRIQFHHV